MYCVAFFYEQGSLSYFDIPQHHIRVSISTLVISIIACLTALVTALNLVNLITPLVNMIWTTEQKRTKIVVSLNVFLLVPIIFIIANYPLRKEIFLWSIAALCFFNFLYFGIPIIFAVVFRDRRSMGDQIDESLKADDTFDLQALLRRRGIKVDKLFFATFVTLIFVGMGWVVGNSGAVKMTDFDVIEGTNYFIVRQYDDVLLVKEFDEKNKEFGDNYALMPLEGEIKIARKKIGRLKKSEQDGAEQTATAPESKPEDNSNPQPESEVRPQ